MPKVDDAAYGDASAPDGTEKSIWKQGTASKRLTVAQIRDFVLAAAAFTEAVQDVVGQFTVGAGPITVSYGDSPNQLVISLSGLVSGDIGDFTEAVQDVVGQFTVGSGPVSVAYGDSPNQLVISLSGLLSTDVGDFTEAVQDVVGQFAVGSGALVVTYGDSPNQLVFSLDTTLIKPTESMIVACGDESTAITAGTGKVTWRMPYAFTVTEVRASLVTAQSTNGGGGIFTVDINESGTTILSTKLTIDNTEKTSTTAATAPVISDSSLADDAEMSVDVDQIGDGTAKGLKIILIGHRT